MNLARLLYLVALVLAVVGAVAQWLGSPADPDLVWGCLFGSLAAFYGAHLA